MSSSGAARERATAGGEVPAGACLCVSRGFYEGLDVPIDGPRLVLGRGQGADVVIAESTMSRRHAAIGYRDGDFYIEDLGSTNGTYVNGKARRSAELRDGDEIRLGRLELRARVPA